MKKTEYKLKDRYDYKLYRTDRSNDPEYTELKTVPGQTISLKELVARHEQGRPIPGGLYEEPGELGEMKAAQFSDADFQQAMRVDPLTAKDEIQRELTSLKAQREQREAKAKTDKLEAEKQAKIAQENAENESLENEQK